MDHYRLRLENLMNSVIDAYNARRMELCDGLAHGGLSNSWPVVDSMDRLVEAATHYADKSISIDEFNSIRKSIELELPLDQMTKDLSRMSHDPSLKILRLLLDQVAILLEEEKKQL